ncbi:MAG TPA: ABC transporter substrate-binding protein [Acidimicrobiales bacterium]|nr:ABC transporter substrate-binding protein [Acidimicrobiales bacterium]
MRTRLVKVAVVATMLGWLAAAFGFSAGSAGASGTPLKIAFITSQTGVASSEFQGSQQGFLARVALQNAEGGVNGQKIDPIVLNDQSGTSTVAAAVNDAISQGAIGVVSNTPFMFAGYKILQQQGIPVTGGSFDGPEWGVQPNTNMFASDSGSIDPTYPANTGFGAFMKAHGGTVLGSYGYGISPSSSRSAEDTATSVKDAGLKVGVLDTTVSFGGVDFTTAALQAKQAGVNTVWAAMDNNSNFALVQAFEQAGVHLKVVVFPTGLEADVIHSPAWQSLQNVYFLDETHPFQEPNAATTTFKNALVKYEHMSPKSFPPFDVVEAWMGADLMIKGIELAGKNPTHAGIIHALRHVTAYNAGGLLAESFNYATNFGHDAPQTCEYYLQAKANGFVPVAGASPFCGKDIPGSGTVSAPSA